MEYKKKKISSVEKHMLKLRWKFYQNSVVSYGVRDWWLIENENLHFELPKNEENKPSINRSW